MLNTLLKDIAPLLIQNAPIISTLLTGSPLVGVALKLIGDAFGSSSFDPLSILETIQKSDNPESILQTLEQQHAGWIKVIPLIKLPQSFELSLKIIWPNEEKCIS